MGAFMESRDSVLLLEASRSDLNAKRLAVDRDDRRFSTRIILLIVVPILILLSNTFFERPTDPCPGFPQSMGEGSPLNVANGRAGIFSPTAALAVRFA